MADDTAVEVACAAPVASAAAIVLVTEEAAGKASYTTPSMLGGDGGLGTVAIAKAAVEVEAERIG